MYTLYICCCVVNNKRIVKPKHCVCVFLGKVIHTINRTHTYTNWISHTINTMSTPRVRFSDEIPTPIVLPEGEYWRAARIGPWQRLARDRARFKRRIELTEKAISWIFTPAHRHKIFTTYSASQTQRAPTPRGIGSGLIRD